MNTPLIIFWVSLGLAIYHHAAYPSVLRLIAARVRHRQGCLVRQPVETAKLPSVQIVVPAHNEEQFIAAKIRNLTEIDYPPKKLKFTLILDGCEDRTRAIAAKCLAVPPVNGCWQLIVHDRLGKIKSLNQALASATSEIVALSDASALINSDALRIAAHHFRDPRVGVVCGTYSIGEAAGPGETAYWKYQVRVKKDEAAVAAPMGAHGAFYLFRRALWTPLPDDTINDDFVIPLRIALSGYRVVYETAIVALELEATATKQEFSRRVRIGAGNLQQLLHLPQLADPRRGMLAFVFLSGKGMRALMPGILLLNVLSTAVLSIQGSWSFSALLLGELLTGVLVAGNCLGAQFLPKAVKGLNYIIIGYVAAAIGCLRLLSGHHHTVWKNSLAHRRSMSAHGAEQ